MIVRIGLPKGYDYLGQDHVLVEADSIVHARYAVVRATGVAVRDQGRAFIKGYVGNGPDGNVIYVREPRENFYVTWVPEGAVFDDDKMEEEVES
jgi:hypothetical protein